jgi:hypothetical protein
VKQQIIDTSPANTLWSNRVLRKMICLSKSIHMHYIVMGLFINRFAFGMLVYKGHLYV